MWPELNHTLLELTDGEFQDLTAFVYRKYGIDLSRKRKLIEGRLSNTLKAKRLTSFGQYLQLLQADRTGEEMQLFLNKITTNYSYFARENDHFEFLMNTALPALEKRRQGDLRIWSAGCSAGQEAYTIAMVMHQYFGARKSAWDTTVLATDISPGVLEKAKAGVYPEKDLEGLPAQWKQKYFTRVTADSFQVSRQLRDEVVFKSANLMEPFACKKPFDIIFCRNVMIYFDAATTSALLRKFYDATARGGYLFIGHSEAIDRKSTGYVCLGPAVYQKPQELAR